MACQAVERAVPFRENADVLAVFQAAQNFSDCTHVSAALEPWNRIKQVHHQAGNQTDAENMLAGHKVEHVFKAQLHEHGIKIAIMVGIDKVGTLQFRGGLDLQLEKPFEKRGDNWFDNCVKTQMSPMISYPISSHFFTFLHH